MIRGPRCSAASTAGERAADQLALTELLQFVAEAHRAEDMLAVAIKHRPELALLDLDLRSEELALRRAENDRLPQIDVGVSANVAGQDSRYRDALGAIRGADAPGYSVMLNLTSTPLGRATGAAAEAERAKQRIAIATRNQAIQGVCLAVRDAVRAQHSAALQVAAAARFRELSTQSLGSAAARDRRAARRAPYRNRRTAPLSPIGSDGGNASVRSRRTSTLSARLISPPGSRAVAAHPAAIAT